MAFLDCIHHTSSSLMQNINVSKCEFVIENNQIYHNVQLKDPKPTLNTPPSCIKFIDDQGNYSNYKEHLRYPILSPINTLSKHSSWDSIQQIFYKLFNFFLVVYNNEYEHKLLNSNVKYDMIRDFCKYICFVSLDTQSQSQGGGAGVYNLSILYRHLLLSTESVKKNKNEKLIKNFLIINDVFHYLIFRKSNKVEQQITPCNKNCKLKKFELFLININVNLLHNIYCLNNESKNKLISNKLICTKYSKIFNFKSQSNDYMVNLILQ